MHNNVALYKVFLYTMQKTKWTDRQFMHINKEQAINYNLQPRAVHQLIIVILVHKSRKETYLPNIKLSSPVSGTVSKLGRAILITVGLSPG